MPHRARLADDIGLDDEDREAVYYSALLVNVGCHTDARAGEVDGR